LLNEEVLFATQATYNHYNNIYYCFRDIVSKRGGHDLMFRGHLSSSVT